MDRAKEVLVEGCRIHGCSDEDVPDRAGILFRSAQGEVRECSLIGGRNGIRAQRSAGALDLASHLFVRACTVSDALYSCIRFLSSQGLAEGNECWGSRKNSGIVVQRDSNSLDAPSEVTLRGNRCHDNNEAGIVFASSNGLAEYNECWGSRTRSGIFVQRDPNSYDTPSEVTLRGNSCHDNELDGISFLSAKGLAEGNECWGSRTRSGIFVQRDPNSCDAPSEVTLRGNSCHDNELDGISFFSAKGLAEGNECWGSRTGSGIFLQHDAKSPGAPSDVTLRGNRCHDNEIHGIHFTSCKGLAEDNECWSSRDGSGIFIFSDSNSCDAPNDLVLRRNRCHDNEHAGICFSSAKGLAEYNECWGSRARGGIVVQPDRDSSDAPSEVTLRGNSCHDNELDGICFISAKGLAEYNECWGSRKRCGIAVERDSDSPGAPSEVTLRANRCHDNERHGISFDSSKGLAEYNECWGSRTRSGIVVQHDADFADSPSEVTLRSNRCHDNEQAGIVFASSNGLAEYNECWGCRTHSGIVVQPSPDSRGGPNKVTLRGNRCHDNELAGIIFFSSNGQAENNECWGNKANNEVVRQTSPAVTITHHHTLPQVPPHELRLAHHAAHPLAAWLRAGPEPELRHRLADFVWSGCAHCLASWQGGRRREPRLGSTPVPDLEKVPHLFTLKAQETRGGAVQIARARLVQLLSEGATQSPAPGLPMLDALLARVGALEHARRGKRSPKREPIEALREPVALVSADTPALDAWLQDKKRQRAALGHRQGPRGAAQGFRLMVLDGLGHDAGGTGPAGETGFLVASLLRGCTPLQKCLKALRAWLQAPLDAVVISLLIAGLGLAFVTWWLAPAGASPLAPALTQLLAAPGEMAAWGKLREAVSAVWSAGFPLDDWKTLVNLLLVVVLLLPPLTRLLPEPLNPASMFLRALTKIVMGCLGLKDAAEAVPMPQWLRRVLSWWLQSASATRSCLRRELYGEPLFAPLWRRRWPLTLVLVRGVDAPSPAQQEEMRQVMALCPRRHHLLLVMQMPGLAMVTGGFLDTWFTPGQAWPPQAWLIHDPTSIGLPTGGEDKVGPEALVRLSALLGWPRSEGEDEKAANTLGKATDCDLHPLLVLGSTAHAHLTLWRANQSYSHIAESVWRRWQRLLWALPGHRRVPGDNWLEKQDKATQLGTALLLVKGPHGQRMAWVGRAGWRRALAAALQGYFQQQRGTSADSYLAKLLAGAEREHLRSSRRHWRAWRGTEPTDRTALQRGLLHLEAALDLALERGQLGGSGDDAQLRSDWRMVGIYAEAGRRELEKADRLRLAGVLLRAEERYSEEAGPKPLLAKALAEPLDKSVPKIWAELAGDFRDLSDQLAVCGAATAAEVLDSLRRQEWAALPDAIHQALRDRVAARAATAWHRLKAAKTEAELSGACAALAGRPMLLLGLLGRMATASVRHHVTEGSNLAEALGEVADGLLVLADALPPELPTEELPDWQPLGETPVCNWAARLLREPLARQTLAEAIAQADARLTKLRRAASAEGIEGLAMGTHGAINRELSQGADAEDWELREDNPGT
nr:right-handed parallel beta-helix repeat-containing protein [Paucibacter sp. KBW04]